MCNMHILFLLHRGYAKIGTTQGTYGISASHYNSESFHPKYLEPYHIFIFLLYPIYFILETQPRIFGICRGEHRCFPCGAS